MKKLGAALLMTMALVGCGGPLEDDGTDATGASQQALLDVGEPPRFDRQGRAELRSDLLKTPGEGTSVPAFQEQQHLTNPIKRGDCR